MTLSPCLTCKCMHNPLNDNIAGSRYILESEQLIAPSDTSIKYVKYDKLGISFNIEIII